MDRYVMCLATGAASVAPLTRIIVSESRFAFLSTSDLSSEWVPRASVEETLDKAVEEMPNKPPVADAVHKLLDLLPNSLAFNLDIFVSVSNPAKNLSPFLYSSLKRATEWFGANVYAVASKKASPSEDLTDLRGQVVTKDMIPGLNSRLFWRGSLGLLSDQDYEVLHMPGFELHLNLKEPKDNVIDMDKLRMANCLRVVAQCSVNHLSPDLLTETLFDVSITDLDLGLRFWNDESIFHAGKCCLIVKLHFSSVDKLSAGANRSFFEWTKAISNGNIDKNLDDHLSLASPAIFLALIPDQSQNSRSGSAVLLKTDHSASFAYCSLRTPGASLSICQTDEEIQDQDAEGDERRLLSFLDYLNQQRTKAKVVGSDTLSPANNLILLDTKEILKHFTPEGVAIQGSKLEPIHPRTPREDADRHGHYENLNNRCEEIDKEAMRIQRIYVGSKETASTCQSDPIKPIVLNPGGVEKPKLLPPKAVTKTKVRGLRREPSRQSLNSSLTSNKSKEEIHKQKLRNAVYEALVDKGIDEKHKLFRSCFKKLFDICKMYEKDMPKSGSTKLWLRTVAKQNAETVVNLAIAMNG